MNITSNLLREKLEELEKENLRLKQQQIEVSEAKELYLKIFEEFPALIWRSRLDKQCDYFNKTWLEFTGRTFEQEFGNGWTEGVHPDDYDFCLETYVNAFEKREAFLMEYRLKNKFGEYRWIRDFGRPFYDLDNSFLGYIGSCYDITEIKNNEIRLEELNATKNKFFSIIAHDLKLPFSSIVGFSELLLEQVKTRDYDKIEKYATIILNSSNKAMDLISNLMTWSHLESDKIPFNPGHFDLNELVNDEINLLNATAERKSIDIENMILQDEQVFADKEMIRAVLRNLISNALKFTRTGGKITISAKRNIKELIVFISDNGVGIPEERLKNLFTITENHSTPGTQNETGTGLGLILCNEFIEKNKGKIWAESKAGIGSTFYFSLQIENKNL